MIKINKFLVAFLITGFVSASINGFAFAAETEEKVQSLEATLTDDTNGDITKATDESLAEDDLNLGQAEEVAPEDTPENADGYDIFYDEQGEAYYVEKEPAEQEIVETVDVTEPEEEKDKEEAKPSYSEKDVRLLASLIYSEARGQSYEGMLAVANVVLNRMKSNVYSHVDTVKEVIYDKKWSVQFAVTIKSRKTGLSMMDKALQSYDTGKFTGGNPEAEKKAMNKAIKAAKAALQGENNIGNYLCFNAVNKNTSNLKKKYSDYKIIGDHIFYRTK